MVQLTLVARKQAGLTPYQAKRGGITIRAVPKSRSVYEADVLDAWVTEQLDESWTASYRLAVQEGYLVVAELRIHPTEEGFSPGDWSGIWKGAKAKVPDGGLTARTRNKAKLGAHITSGRHIAAVWRKRAQQERRRSSLVARLQKLGVKRLNPPPRAGRGGRPGFPIKRYRRAARLYQAAIDRESLHPNQDVAEALGITAAQARDMIYRARHRHGLLPGTNRGKARGR